MKKIINGKVYNTDTARKIGDYQYSNSNDFKYWYEAIYQTKKGQFFMYYEGGAASKYNRCVGNGSFGGDSGIKLLDQDEVKDWCEEYLSVDDYEVIFGECEEG